MDELDEHSVHCPYCDAPQVMLVDPSGGNRRYTEDCQICCQPIEVFVHEDMDGHLSVELAPENE